MLASTMKPEHETEPVPTFFLSENESIPCWKGTILTIAQIMKYVVSSTAEAEMTVLFLTANESLSITQESVGSKQLWVHCYGLAAL